jgi:exodeoxyribonuclease-5
VKNEENFKLTKSQEVLLVKLKAFLKSPERIFLLTGKPGVGKTTMNKICLADQINEDIESQSSGQNIQVAGIALAHRAKNELGKHIPNVFTFAKAYSLKEKINDDGSITFEYNSNGDFLPIGEVPVPVFVHDEVSQYTAEMLKIVLDKTSVFSKIILMGDKAQLPPIDPENKMGVDEDSPVFKLDLPDSCKHELTERVRQAKGNPILELSDVIREEIFGNQNILRVLNEIRTPKMVNGFGYDYIGYPQLGEHLEGKNQMETCVIAFRNRTVTWFNYELRDYLLKSPEEDLISGDLICMLYSFYHKTSDGQISFVLHNSDTFKISKIYKKFIHHKIKDEVYKIECYIGKVAGQTLKEIVIPTEKGIDIYDTVIKNMAELCKAYKMKWNEFYTFKQRFSSCSYGYSITAYKAQGSTYDTVYVDINDVLLTRPLTPKRKLQTIYTAITRARKDVYFLKARV